MPFFGRESEPLRQVWEYQPRPMPRHEEACLLPAPETLGKKAKKFWKDQKYGIWSFSPPAKHANSDKTDIDATRHYILHSREVNLLKSLIAQKLIDEDTDRFTSSQTPNKYQAIYEEIVRDNKSRLDRRAAELENYLQENLQGERALILFKQIRGTLSETAELFVIDIKPTKGKFTEDWKGPSILFSMLDRINALNMYIPTS